MPVGGVHASADAFGRLLSVLANCWRWRHSMAVPCACSAASALCSWANLAAISLHCQAQCDHMQFVHMLLTWMPVMNHGWMPVANHGDPKALLQGYSRSALPAMQHAQCAQHPLQPVAMHTESCCSTFACNMQQLGTKPHAGAPVLMVKTLQLTRLLWVIQNCIHLGTKVWVRCD
jgi:hypothetical protein